MLNEDEVNEEVDSGQSDGEENGEVEQAPPVPQPQHQANYYNSSTQGPTLNGVTTMNVISTSVTVQQMPPEQIPVQVQQHIVRFILITKMYLLAHLENNILLTFFLVYILYIC